MLLHTLIRAFNPSLPLSGLPNTEIGAVREDSRRVRPGDLFIARPGARADGSQFLHDAKARGAVAAVVPGWVEGVNLPQVVIGPDDRRVGSVLANLVAGRPSETVRVLGVTGTNGKTTTAYLVRHLLAKLNVRCGMIGTVEIDDGRSRRSADMTTPGACDLAELLGAMRDKGCRACAMEVSSHALDQGRVAGVGFAGAAFTNLTGDHLDYHKTMDNYAAAKASLFDGLDASAVAVVNVDDKYAARMVEKCAARVIRFGFGRAADYTVRDIETTSGGTRFTLIGPGGKESANTLLIGRHNLQNVLAATALVAETFEATLRQLASGLADAPARRGGFSRFGRGSRSRCLWITPIPMTGWRTSFERCGR